MAFVILERGSSEAKNLVSGIHASPSRPRGTTEKGARKVAASSSGLSRGSAASTSWRAVLPVHSVTNLSGSDTWLSSPPGRGRGGPKGR
jgi:hypothetical protein